MLGRLLRSCQGPPGAGMPSPQDNLTMHPSPCAQVALLFPSPGCGGSFAVDARSKLYIAAQRSVTVGICLDAAAVGAQPGPCEALLQLFSPLVTQSLHVRCSATLQELRVDTQPTGLLECGTLLTRTRHTERVLLFNRTGVPLRVKAFLEAPVPAAQHAHAVNSAQATEGPRLELDRPELVLQPYSSAAVKLAVSTGCRDGAALEGYVLAFAVNGPGYVLPLPVSGRVLQPKLVLEWQGPVTGGAAGSEGPWQPLAPDQVLQSPALQPGEQAHHQLRLRNTGEPPCAFQLQPPLGHAPLLAVSCDEGEVPVGGAVSVQLSCLAPELGRALERSSKRAECTLSVAGCLPVTFAAEWLVALGRVEADKGILFELDPADDGQLKRCYDADGVFQGLDAAVELRNPGDVAVAITGLADGPVTALSPLPVTLQPGSRTSLLLRVSAPSVLAAVAKGGKAAPGSITLLTTAAKWRELRVPYNIRVLMPAVESQRRSLDLPAIGANEQKPLRTDLILRNSGATDGRIQVVLEPLCLTRPDGQTVPAEGCSLQLKGLARELELSTTGKEASQEHAPLELKAGQQKVPELRALLPKEGLPPGTYTANVKVCCALDGTACMHRRRIDDRQHLPCHWATGVEPG
jgi:hypothetical protein